MSHRLGFNPFFLPCLLYLLALTSVSRDTNKFETGPLSAVEVAPGDDIQIRSMAVLSGTGALGIPSQRGVMLALADYGPIQVRNVSMGAGLVMVGPSTTSPSLTSDLNGTAGSNHHPGYYRTAHNDLCQAQAVAIFAYNERHLRSVAVIHEGDPYKSGPTGAFTAAFEEIGGYVAAVAINKGDTNMLHILTQIAFGAPEGLFFPLFPDKGANIVHQIEQLAGLERVTLIGGSALLVSDFLSLP